MTDLRYGDRTSMYDILLNLGMSESWKIRVNIMLPSFGVPLSQLGVCYTLLVRLVINQCCAQAPVRLQRCSRGGSLRSLT